ncbi:MAG: hypothetical protein NTV33_11635 [Coprothermobacterota bacterium]|nr:hypothetical protein [Coprothermobacterota bacterium]
MKKKEIVQKIGLPKQSPSQASLPPGDDESRGRGLVAFSPEPAMGTDLPAMGTDLKSVPIAVRYSSPGKRLFGYFLLGLFLAALELAAAIYTKLLNWPGVFIGLFFSLSLLISLGALRRPGNGAYFFLTMVSYSVALLGAYLFQRLVLLKSPLVLWNIFYYFLLYVWPGILAALCAALLRALLRPTPSPSLAPLRRQAELHRRVQRRAEGAGPGTARPLRLEQEMRRRATRRKEKQ